MKPTELVKLRRRHDEWVADLNTKIADLEQHIAEIPSDRRREAAQALADMITELQAERSRSGGDQRGEVAAAIGGPRGRIYLDDMAAMDRFIQRVIDLHDRTLIG